MNKLTEKYDFMMDLLKNADWTFVKEADGVITENTFIPGSSIACFKSSGIVNGDIMPLMNFIWSKYDSIENIRKYDIDVTHYQIIETIDDDTRISHQINRLPWPLWPRDICYLQHRVFDNKMPYLLVYSVESRAAPQQDDKYVRANVTISAYIFEEITTESEIKCKITRIAHVDPMGLIPASVINSYADKNATMIRYLMKCTHDPSFNEIQP